MGVDGFLLRLQTSTAVYSPCNNFSSDSGDRCWTALSSSDSKFPQRFQGPCPDTRTPDQQRIIDDIQRTRSTGIRGPFGPWLANPALADSAQKLGRVCRYETSLELRHSELIILMTAVHHKSRTEWIIHEHEAVKAGLESDIIDALREHRVPNFSNPTDKALFAFTSELLTTSKVGENIYANLKREIGDVGIVEVVGIVGYYGLVALTLNVFQVQP